MSEVWGQEKLSNQEGNDDDLYYSVYSAVIYITRTCSNAKGNIYFWNYLFSFVSFVVCDAVRKKYLREIFQNCLHEKLANSAANQHIKFIGTTSFSCNKY